MNEIASNDDSDAHTSKGFTLSELISGNGIQFEVNLGEGEEEEKNDFYYDTPEVLDYMNPTELLDEDVYDESQPFELISEKMTNVLEDGKIKKRILKEGLGVVIPDLSVVTVHYNSYLEYSDEPFDSTYLRKRPFVFRLSSGETLPGLDLAVATMKPNEKSQFLVHPDYAYGKLGCLDRIPPNSYVLFEIELKSYSNSGAAVTYEKLNEDKQKTFEEIHKYILALCVKGNEYFQKRNYKTAVREYNTAISKLEYCELADYEEQEIQQKLLLRLFINIAITYSMLQEPRKCCVFCNKIYYLTKGTTLKIPAKVYFHNARALMQLSDFKYAEKRLLQAKRLEPNNTEIAQEFKILEDLRKKEKERDKALAQVVFSKCTLSEDSNKEEISLKAPSDSFKKVIEDICKEILEKNEERYKLPPKLTLGEKNFIKEEVNKYNLHYLQEGPDDVYILKK